MIVGKEQFREIYDRISEAFGRAVIENDAAKQDLVRNRYYRVISAARKRQLTYD